MKYLEFEIKNFKGIKEIKIDLSIYKSQKVFSLVGLNESGKTTILEAINFFFEENYDEDEHSLIPKSEKANFNGDVSVTANISLDDTDNNILKNRLKGNNKFSIDQKITNVSIVKRFSFVNSEYHSSGYDYFYKIIGRKRGSQNIRELKTNDPIKTATDEFISNHLIPTVVYYPNFLFDFPEKIYLTKLPNEPKEQSFYRFVIQDILDSLDRKLKIKEHLIDRLNSGSPQNLSSLDSTLNLMKGKITAEILDTWKNIFKKSEGRKIVIKTETEEINGENIHSLEFILEEGIEPYKIKERSLGFTWYFAYLLFTEFRKHRKTDRGEILFLLDEPASNLHSRAQTELLATFKKLISKSKLIYTTHSQHLINPDWLEGAFIVKNKASDYDKGFDFDTSKTEIAVIPYKQFVAKHPNQQTYFQPILDALEYSPSKLENIPNIVLTEGKYDYYTFKYFRDNYFKTKFNKINFFPGGGAGKQETIIGLYIAWGKTFSVNMGD